MTIPFLDLFKRLTGRSESAVVEPPAPATPARVAKKSASEKLSKTVLPHATRSFSAPDPFRSASAAPSPGRPAPLQLGAQRVTSTPRAQKGHLPPALAKALEPKLERTISLRIADFIERVPTGYIKPVEILDSAVRVSLKASEIEKGMPEKKPTISLPSLYQQVPEIFLRGVRPDDDTRVSLPYEKVLEQFSAAQVRDDQVRDPAVPQLDTPILKATIQDSERFGTKIEPIETAPLPSVPVLPATAKAIAEAEPDAVVVAQETKKTVAPSGHPVVSLYSPELKPKSEPPAPKKIPFIELSPNGTGASASERVPASSGPPVPTPLPFSPELAKIAFQPPPEKTKTVEGPKISNAPVAPKLTAAPTAKKEEAPISLSLQAATGTAAPQPKPVPPSTAEGKSPEIALALQPIIENLPGFQWHGELGSVESHEVVVLPLNLIQPQLASGRISISPDIFAGALPQKHRASFEIGEAKTPVLLPLEEVLKNLPATILKLRDDQESAAVDQDFETPFSIKAKEDAERLAPKKATEEKTAEAKIDIAPAETPKPEEKIDPKKTVEEALALDSVAACVITFADGLTLAGSLPEELAAGGLCAIAPSFLSRIDGHMRESKLGELVTMTVYSANHAISFFAKQNICLAVLHKADSLPAETRKELAARTEKLSAHYAKPE